MPPKSVTPKPTPPKVKPKPQAAGPGMEPKKPVTPIPAVGDKPSVIVQEAEIRPPDMPSQSVVSSGKMEGEFVASGAWGWLSDRYLPSLPNPTDRFMRDFGSKLYE